MSAAIRQTVPAQAKPPHHAFGSLGDILAKVTHGRELMGEPGPVAKAFVESNDPAALLNGPRGSAKTTTVFKKMVVETMRMRPLRLAGYDEPVRLYVPQVMRPKYKNLWGTTIKSWWKIFPVDAFPEWTGGSGRDADHIIHWRDDYGLCKLHVLFRALAEGAEEDDTRGSECTDAVLEEMDTHDENTPINITGSLARNPVRSLMNRNGKIYGSCNAPDVTNWVYRDFFEKPKPGYKLYRQPGGLEPDAENIQVVTRGYYHNQIKLNAQRPWWINKMIHNRPGYSREHDVIFPDFDDATHMAASEIPVMKEIPVIIGLDGGFTPAAVLMQMPPPNLCNILAEVALPRGDEDTLADHLLTLMAQPRFEGCEFVGCCDPAMDAGAELPNGSMRMRLEKRLGIKIYVCHTNDPLERHAPLQRYTRERTALRPALQIDPSCKTIRRGFNQTFHHHIVHGTNARSATVKNADSHVCEAAEYATLLGGRPAALKRRKQIEAERDKRRASAGPAQRYNPHTRRFGG